MEQDGAHRIPQNEPYRLVSDTDRGGYSQVGILILWKMAVGQGFEPREGYKPSAVFKTAAFGHSASPPFFHCRLATAR